MKFVSILEDGDKFDKLVKDAPALAKFFHPSCGHSRYVTSLGFTEG